jgi:hypothetical protein
LALGILRHLNTDWFLASNTGRGVNAPPRGHDAGARYLADFIEDVKASGFVARAIEKNKIRGLTVAPPAPR